MIQVCSRCGTRWNVRDRRRDWCPRCQGTLLAPTADAPDQRWGERPTASALQPGQPTAQRLPQGYRWIAVRPGAAPPPRSIRRPLGPTPRYGVIPRWGLTDRFDDQYDPATPQPEVRSGPSAAMVRRTLWATVVILGVAAIVHIARYALLLINRSTLLNPWVAGIATWLGVARQRGGAVRGDRQRGRPDELADRAAGIGVRAPGHGGSALGVGDAGRLPGAVRQPVLGAGVPHRTGRRRGQAQPAAARPS